MMKKLLAAAAIGAAGGTAQAQDQVTLHTTAGDITIALDAENAPVTVENFLTYARDGFYDGTIFHRVIEGFMIQGGGFTQDMQQKPTRAPIVNEGGNGLKNKRGTVAMARTSAPDSATSQFFINHGDNAFLDRGVRDPHGYAVFGKVTDGMTVVDKIASVTTTRRGGHSDVPVQPVVIESVTLGGADDAETTESATDNAADNTSDDASE